MSGLLASAKVGSLMAKLLHLEMLCLAAAVVLPPGCQGTILRPGTDGQTPPPSDSHPATDGSEPRPDGTIPPADVPAADGKSPCDNNEAHLDGYCYRAVGMGAMTHEMALQSCDAINAQPVSIHSDEENQLVYDLLYMWTSCAWIGITREGDEPVWVDGTAMDYSNWQAGEPDDDACFCIGGPYASAVNQGKWRDSRCSAQLREIVCKRKP